MLVVPADCIVAGEADKAMPEGTIRLTVWLAETPSPEAVTVIGASPKAVEGAAVSVWVLVPDADESVAGLLLQDADTPLGSPITFKFTGALNEPPAWIVNTPLTVRPGNKVIRSQGELSLSDGGDATARVGKASVRFSIVKANDIHFERLKKVDLQLNKTDRQMKELLEDLAKLMPFELNHPIGFIRVKSSQLVITYVIC